MASRKTLSKKTRFEVFKRDKFTCQYCGRSSPDVVLNCDHIDPVANGGGNEILNLITSCEACNAGKKDRLLDDSVAVKLQVDQLKQLEERRQQLEMLMQWKNELLSVDDKSTELLSEFWTRLTNGERALTEHGKKVISKLVKTYSVDEVADAMKGAVDFYVKDGTSEQFAKAFDSISRCCNVNRREKENPGSKELYFIRGIVRNKLSNAYFNPNECMRLLEQAVQCGVPLEELRYIAKSNYSSFTRFKNGVVEAINLACEDQS